jgi:hypothetical protein
VAVAAGASRWVSDPVYADKERTLRRLEAAAPPGAPRVILLGTSRAGCGFAAGRAQRTAADAGFAAVVFNCGLPGAGPVTHRLYLPRLLEDGHRPDLLLLEVLPPLLADRPDGPVEARTITGDMLTRAEVETMGAYGLPAGELRRQRGRGMVEPLTVHRFKLVSRVCASALPWYRRYDWGRPVDPNGWNPFEVTNESDPAERARRVAATVAEYHAVVRCPLPAGPGAAALRDTLDLCRTANVPVRLVVLPETTAFGRVYPPGAPERVAAFLAGLTAEFGCPLTDARGWLPDDAFLDGHHLLPGRAPEFTDRLTGEVILPFLRARVEGRTAP